ncbi:MAG: replication initiator protein [Arizlama microvirus]|nr:MAG: replication initiator protein [Arizlama microvirus]
MNCINPYKMETCRKKDGTLISFTSYPKGYLELPCGKCLPCRIAKSREWALRCLHELNYWKSAVFVTLTYDDENLVKFGLYPTIQVRELQNFFKRLRKKLLNLTKIKYYACGEYGELSCRPHYHVIIYGISPEECFPDSQNYATSGIIKESWTKGHVFVGNVNYDSCRYVAQYIDKKYYGQLADEIYHATAREIPFQMVSSGFGKQFLIDNEKQLTENMYTTVHGVKYGLPMYYKKFLKLDKEKIKGYSQKLHNITEYTIINRGINDSLLIDEAINKARLQNEMTLRAKIELKKNKKKL